MKLEKIIIHRLPGISGGFELETNSTVCIVVGPNGSGKSSLTRAVRSLLWSTENPGIPFAIEVFFTWNNSQWKARREEAMPTIWIRDGQEVDAPDLPAGPVARCYEMGLLDLVIPVEGEVEKQLAGIINEEMSGGVNLSQISKNLFAFSSRLATTRKRTLFESEKDFTALLRQQKQLFEQEKRSAEMQRELDRCNTAETEASLLRSLKERNEAVIELEAVRFQLDIFEKGQSKVRPDDNSTLESLNRLKREKRALIQEDSTELKILNKQLNDLEIPPRLKNCGLLERQITEAVALDNRINQYQVDLSRQNAVIEQTLSEFSPGTEPDFPDVTPGPEAYRDFSRAYARVAGFQALTESLDALLALPELNIQSQPTDSNEELLRRWLSLPEGVAEPGLLIGLISAILSTVAGGILWTANRETVGLGVMIAGAGLIGYSTWTGLRVFKQNRQRKTLGNEIISRCRNLGIALNPPLTRTDAQKILDQETESLITAEVRQVLQNFLVGQRQHQNEKKTGVESILDELYLKHGLNLDGEIPDLLNLLNIIPRFRKARDEAASTESAIIETRNQYETHWLACNKYLADIGFPKPETILEAQQLLDDLKTKLKKRDLFQEKLERHQKTLARHQNDIDEIEDQLAQFWKRLELSPQNDDLMVRQLVDQLPRWENVRDREVEYTKEVDILDRRFSARPDWFDADEAEKMSSEELDLQLENLAQATQSRPTLQEELSTLKIQVAEARGSLQVAEARAKKDQARDALMEIRTEEQEKALGRLLLENVQQTYQHTSRPAILSKASDNFKEFTLGRYELRVIPGEDDHGRFIAFDCETKENLSLAKLSDGTRAQLLLSVRLAFISQHEQSARPPIFMDESLTSSDPERFAAIAGRLAAWAEARNRQVFYLTSNPNDAKAWESILQSTGLPRPEILNLAEARNLKKGKIPLFEYSPVASAPAPGKMSAAQYARTLSIPELNPWQHPAETHLWYLLQDDLPQLHRLVMAAAPTWGRLQSRRKELQNLGVLSTQKLIQLEARGLCLNAFHHYWRVGRSRLITAETLISSQAVSSSFLEKCRDLLHEVQGDPIKFISSLKEKKVKRFTAGNIELLEIFLQDEGYLGQGSIYSSEELLEAVFSSTQEEVQREVLSVSEIRELVMSWFKLASK